MPLWKRSRREQPNAPAPDGAALRAESREPSAKIADVERLDTMLRQACRVDITLETLGSLVNPLHELCGTSFLDRRRLQDPSRSPWECLASWATDAEVPGIIRARIAFFCSLWNENIRQQAYLWGQALGYPSDDQVSRIENGAFDACAQLEPSLIVAQGDNVLSFQRDLASRLSRPIPPDHD